MATKLNLSYEKEDMVVYENLTTKPSSPFYKSTMADVFIFAVCLARLKNLQGARIKVKTPNIPLDALKDRKWLFYSIAISDENSHKVIFNEETILEKIEQIANSGIKLLNRYVFDEPGNFYQRIELLNKEIEK